MIASSAGSMTDWFHTLAAGSELSPAAIHALRSDGFVVVPGPVAQDKLARLAEAYDRAILEADPVDVAIGRTTIRVNDSSIVAPSSMSCTFTRRCSRLVATFSGSPSGSAACTPGRCGLGLQRKGFMWTSSATQPAELCSDSSS